MKSLFFNIIFLLVSSFFGQAQKVKTGIEVLRERNFIELKGKRLGLITNPTGVDSKLKSTIDILYDSNDVELVALFGPEHGVRGDYSAGNKITDFNDKRTGLPVYSLYGKTRKPTPEMLEGIDILVYDIQDIGSRSYTYISTLGLAMEAAAENKIEFLVLDRPNPLGGLKMEGPIVEKEFISFVSQFPIPYVHGLTCGELANYLNNVGLLTGGIKCKLKVIPMEGWMRSMNFEETELPWVPSSPHIPHSLTCYFYPISGILGELSYVNIGVGYTMPFELFAAKWVDNAEQLASNLNEQNIPGIVFRPIYYKPYYSHFKDTIIGGVQVHITNYGSAPLSLIQFYVLQEMYKMYPSLNIFDESINKNRLNMFDKVCGTNKVRKSFSQRFKVEDIINIWTKDIDIYYNEVSPYFLYQ